MTPRPRSEEGKTRAALAELGLTADVERDGADGVVFVYGYELGKTFVDTGCHTLYRNWGPWADHSTEPAAWRALREDLSLGMGDCELGPDDGICPDCEHEMNNLKEKTA